MLGKHFKENIVNRWYLVLPAIFLFLYIIIRAKVISLTWDEGHTFFEYVRNPNWLPQDYNFMSANNHLLNTWLMKISVSLFGESELALRLPNVLGGGLFLFFLIRLLCEISSDWKIRFAGFILIACNPYLIDYFSIARGYGISISLVMGGMYFIFKFISKNYSLRVGLLALLFFALATLANLTCIHLLFSAAILLSCTVLFFENEKGKIKKTILFLGLTILFVLALSPFIFHLQQAKAFFLGKEGDSPKVIIASLGDAYSYGKTYSSWLSPLLVKLFYLIPFAAIIALILQRKTIQKNNSFPLLLFFSALFFLSFIIPIIQHYVMGTNFLSGRTALFFLPQLFFMVLLLHGNGGKAIQYFISFLSLFSLLHFGLTLNEKYFYDFKEQADVKNAIQLLHERKIPLVANCFANVISSDLPFEEQINYYRMRFEMNNFGLASRKESVPACSYYYLSGEGMKELHQPVEVIAAFPATNTFLFRLQTNEKLNYVTEAWEDFEHADAYPQLKKDSIFIDHQGTYAGGEYQYSMNVSLMIPDSLKGNLVASLNARFYYLTKNTSALLVFAFDDGKNEDWEAMHISNLSDKAKVWTITSWTRPIPTGTKKIRVYLWNRDKTPVLMDNVAIRLLSQAQ